MRALDTGTGDLLAHVENGVGVVTLNRPDRRNALSTVMIERLGYVLRECELDPEVGTVVLTGEGGAFCAGGDVKSMADGEGMGVPHDERVHRQQVAQRETSARLWGMPKPTVAMLPGAAAGAGLSLALACDLRYASETAVLNTAFARVGFAGDYGGTWFMSRLVGSGKAKELYFFPRNVSAAEAARLGLVNEVFGVSELEAEVRRRAEQLAAGPRIAYQYMKDNLNRAAVADLTTCLDMEVVHHLHTGETEDHREGVNAFIEHREPSFRGR